VITVITDVGNDGNNVTGTITTVLGTVMLLGGETVKLCGTVTVDGNYVM
jgi:hypothetical protein